MEFGVKPWRRRLLCVPFSSFLFSMASALVVTCTIHTFTLHALLHSFADPDCTLTPCPDNACQKPMRLRLLGIVLHGVVQMLKLLVSDPSQRLDEVGELGPHVIALRLPFCDHLQQCPNLIVVVVANLRLDSLGACHGRLTTHDSGAPSKTSGHDLPQGIQRGRSHAVLVDQVVERLEMALLLVIHVRHQWSEVRLPADQHRGLGSVNERRGELSGLVHSELLIVSSRTRNVLPGERTAEDKKSRCS